MKPIGLHILVRTIDEEVKTDSGLLLSAEDSTAFRYQMAKVVKPGTSVDIIKEGDTIYFDKRQSHTMIINGEKFTIIQERDVVVVL
ncbi:MAG: co-chaperone GroES [Gammaproteobacteria bacterium]|nr:co-chaperone GroES [Gammaproteobacteria bacterium]